MKKIFTLILITAALALSACGGVTAGSGAEPEIAEKRYYCYAVNEAGNQLVQEEIVPENTEQSAFANELIAFSKEAPEESGSRPLLSEGVSIERYEVTDGVMTLDMSSAFGQLAGEYELLVRAGLVKTFTQIDGISYVQFEVDGKPLLDSSGAEIGRLSTDNFVENAGRTIHTYQNAIMHLYYTDETGAVLVPEERSVYFSSNEPLEKAVVSELIRGTSTEGHYPTLLPETKVLSVTIQEGICYVNFDESFRNSILSVQEDVQIYSIVNSLVDTCNVSRVQFSIDGKSNMVFRESMQLDKMYEKNELLEVGASD